MSSEQPPTRQWHTICLNIVTISTASLGAVIAISGLPELNQQAPTTQFTKIALLLVAAAAHFTLASLTALVIFLEPVASADRFHRTLSIFVYSLFIITIFVLALLLASNIFLDTTTQPTYDN